MVGIESMVTVVGTEMSPTLGAILLVLIWGTFAVGAKHLATYALFVGRILYGEKASTDNMRTWLTWLFRVGGIAGFLLSLLVLSATIAEATFQA